MKTSLIVALLMFPFFVFSQKDKKFEIIGKSEFYNGKNLIITSIANNDMADIIFDKGSSNPLGIQVFVENDSFRITGSLQYPHPILINYYDEKANRGISSMPFFVTPGDKLVLQIKDLSQFENKNFLPFLHTAINIEYNELKRTLGASIDSNGSIKDIHQEQQLMAIYIQQHPSSYVGLWELIFDYYIFSRPNDIEKKIIVDNVKRFSDSIKQTKTYQSFIAGAKQEATLVIGEKFPNVLLEGKKLLFDSFDGNKYTLIDFWFSHCQPCVAQFPALKATYRKFKQKKFEIIGIAAETSQNVNNWKNTIKKSGLTWKQYLDLNSRIADSLQIRSFPSNFLLDSTGKIIKKDVSPEELEAFLKENI